MQESPFNDKAAAWDQNPVHNERSMAIASAIKKMIPLNNTMKALEYGAGTGLLSFLLKDEFREIVLMDSSTEMIRICEEKRLTYNTAHIRPILFDLERDRFGETFDIVFNQMVFHHISDIQTILQKFHDMLNPGGILVIADLYSEDGSFHGSDVQVHHGFDPEHLSLTISKYGFRDISYQPCYNVRRDEREYPVFLIKAVKD